MRKSITLLILMLFHASIAIGCTPSVSPTITLTSTVINPTSTLPETTPTPQGRIIVVTSADDDGSGTFRRALREANAGDTITFDPTVFPPEHLQTIYLLAPLSAINQGNITVDASYAGVVLDGSKIPGGWNSGIEIVSNENIIRGLQVVSFSGAGIVISGGGQNNLVEKNVSCANDFGIGLWGTTTSGNTIEGNYLGVLADGATPQGNKSAGITIMEGANNNFIGPDNHIAFNGHNGIEILNANTTGNMIAQNSIHDNGMGGIHLWDGGNASLAAPILMDFDLATGNVNGITCPYCEVSVYSDAENEGINFEGKSIADNQGVFTLEKASAFKGPVLTATTIDEQGNTSPFSIPTIGSQRTMQLQRGNSHPRLPLETKPSDELEDNRIGLLFSNFWQPFDFQQVIDHEIVPSCLKRVKMTINEGEYFTNVGDGLNIDWSKPELSIPLEMDNYVTQLASHNITVDYILTFWDKANHPNGWEIQSRFKTEEEITRYLEYVHFIVTKFKGRVEYYELWNEPNIPFPLQYIEPADYINLVKRTVPVIREIDPDAKIVVGSTSGSAHADAQEYLFTILQSDILPSVDGVSWHPLIGDVPNSGQFPEYYASYPSLLEQIIKIATENGFRGEFIATEIMYSGPGCGGCDINDPTFSDIVSAKYTARAVILHLGNDVTTGVGGSSSARPVHYNTIRSIANVFAGASASQFTVEVQAGAENLRIFTFTRTDGSKLVALWTDGVAVDDDPGVPSTVKLPGLAGWNVTGIDILNGFEQKLVTENENYDLVIRDLLIKDYPVIIRLSK